MLQAVTSSSLGSHIFAANTPKSKDEYAEGDAAFSKSVWDIFFFKWTFMDLLLAKNSGYKAFVVSHSGMTITASSLGQPQMAEYSVLLW